MTLAIWQRTIVDEAGNILPGASVRVEQEVPGLPLANLFSDRDGAESIGNPFSADPDGFAAFHVVGGAYRVTITSGAFSNVLRYVAIGTGAEFDEEHYLFKDANDDVTGLRNLTQTGYTDLSEISEPASPEANVARVRAVDDGAGVTTTGHKDSSGNIVPWSHFNQSGTGNVTRTQQAKARDWISALDFIPVAEHAAILDGTTTTQVGAYIQAALDAHSHVWLPAGTYDIDGETLEPNSGQRLVGPGKLKKTTATGGFTSDFIEIDTESDIQIKGVQFAEPTGREHAITVITSTDILIEGCKLNEPGQTNGTGCDIFVFKNSSRVRVLNNEIYGGLGGIATGGDKAGNNDGLVSDIIIANNYIEGCDDEAIDINWHTHRCLISGNTIASVGTNNSGNEAIDIGGSVDGTGSICRDIVVVSNTIFVDQTMESGIQVKQYTEGCIVASNTIIQDATNDQNVAGITLSNTRGTIVDGNNIDGFRYGVALSSTNEDLTVDGNHIKGVQLSAISTDSTSAGHVRVTHNTCDGEQSATSYGIQIVDVTEGVCSGNIVKGFQDEDGILINNSSLIVCNGNEISDCDTGIFCLAEGTIMSGNLIYDCNAEGARIAAAHVTFSDNQIRDCVTGAGGQYGLTIAAGSDYYNITGNKIYDTRGGSATQRGVRFLGTANSTDRGIFTGNLIYPFLTTALDTTGQTAANCVNANNISA